MSWLADDSGTLADVLLTALLAYAVVVALLRVTGKRTLSQLNSFDFIVTIALGSLLAAALVSPSVSLLEGLAGIAALVLLQWVVAWGQARSVRMRRIVKAEPRLIFAHGRFIERAAHEERFARDEVLAAVRQAGYARLEDVGAVVIESNGRISVLASSEGSALEGVVGLGERAR